MSTLTIQQLLYNLFFSNTILIHEVLNTFKWAVCIMLHIFVFLSLTIPLDKHLTCSLEKTTSPIQHFSIVYSSLCRFGATFPLCMLLLLPLFTSCFSQSHWRDFIVVFLTFLGTQLFRILKIQHNQTKKCFWNNFNLLYYIIFLNSTGLEELEVFCFFLSFDEYLQFLTFYYLYLFWCVFVYGSVCVCVCVHMRVKIKVKSESWLSWHHEGLRDWTVVLRIGIKGL